MPLVQIDAEMSEAEEAEDKKNLIRASLIFCHHLLSLAPSLLLSFFIIQPITVFKLKANENNPHS
jgi:hypothetical protein